MNEASFSLDKNEPSIEIKNQTAVSVLGHISEEEFKELKKLDDEIFPGMELEEDELRESLESSGVQVVLKNNSNKMIGYMTSLPHDQAISFLVEDDPDLKKDNEALYVESIGILAEYRTLKNALKMWNTFLGEAKNKKYKKITGHFRVSQGLSNIIQERFGAHFFRRMENWADFKEDFDYLELELKDDK